MIDQASVGPVSVKAGPRTGCWSTQRQAEQRGTLHVVRADALHVPAHQHRDRDGRGHREGPPGALPEGVHHDERQHGDEDHHDEEDAQQRGDTAERADLVPRHLSERPSVPPEAAAEDAEVLHRAAEDDPEEDPERAGEVAELGRERRADQRPGTGDRGEVVPEDHPAVGGHEVPPVVEARGRGRPLGIEGEDPCREEGRVEAVRDQVDRRGCDDEPDRVDRLPADEREHAERPGADERDGKPGEPREHAHRRLSAPRRRRRR